jgi:pyruvate-formate lyase-activating enzyme
MRAITLNQHIVVQGGEYLIQLDRLLDIAKRVCGRFCRLGVLVSARPRFRISAALYLKSG